MIQRITSSEVSIDRQSVRIKLEGYGQHDKEHAVACFTIEQLMYFIKFGYLGGLPHQPPPIQNEREE